VWTKSDIRSWLRWAEDKFPMEKIDASKFPTCGSDLCKLKLSDFVQIAGNPHSAEILATHLSHLKGGPTPDGLNSSSSAIGVEDFSSVSQTTCLSQDQGNEVFIKLIHFTVVSETSKFTSYLMTRPKIRLCKHV